MISQGRKRTSNAALTGVLERGSRPTSGKGSAPFICAIYKEIVGWRKK